MNSRDAILQRIRTELANVPPVEAPPVPEVWPRMNPSSEELVACFTRELEAVQGEVIRCGSVEQASTKLVELMDQLSCQTIGSVERPILRELAAGLPSDRVAWTKEGWEPKEMGELAVGMVASEILLADTGTCVVSSGTPEERLMCYLPPVCVVVARVDQLAETMPAAWDRIARETAEPDRRGEFVLITGPSRTADIEKILILGVHGPKRLIVILID